MFNVLTALAMGIVIFAISVGVGTVVLSKFGQAIADCGGNTAWNSTSETCTNATGDYGASTGTLTTKSLQSDLGTSGLAGWTGAIIALSVGLLFIGALMGRKKN